MIQFLLSMLCFLARMEKKSSLSNCSTQSSSNDQQVQGGARWTLNDFEQFFRSFEIADYGLFVPTTNDENSQSSNVDMS